MIFFYLCFTFSCVKVCKNTMPLYFETCSAYIYLNHLQHLRFDNHTKPCSDFGFTPINRAALTETNPN